MTTVHSITRAKERFGLNAKTAEHLIRNAVERGKTIAKAFGEIASRNLSYCDISGNNIFVKLSRSGPTVKMIDIDVWNMPRPFNAKLKNSYILKHADYNKVKNYYIIDIGGSNDGLIASEDFLSFPRGKDGRYYVYNEFEKTGIWLLKNKTANRISILPGKYEALESGDEIYFLDDAGNGTELLVGEKRYIYARKARFLEDKQ